MYITCVIKTNLFFKVVNLVCLLSPQTGAETRGQGVGGSDEVSAGPEGQVGKLLFLAALVLLTPTSCRFPDGFEKFSPPILQLDEVDFYYDPKHVIFSRLSVSADLESRICVVSLLFLCFVSWDWALPPLMWCGLATWQRRPPGVGVSVWAEDFAVLVLAPPPASQGRSAA